MSAATAPQALRARLHATLPEADLAPTALPECDDLRLWLLTPDAPTGPLRPATAHAVMERPAYWAFCWASGWALAATILAQPQLVRGHSVLDFGAGSGIVATAAARAGARRVVACDQDADALAAARANRALNRVAFEIRPSPAAASPFDLVLAADVLYDPANLPLLEQLRGLGRTLLIADARLGAETLAGYHPLGERMATTLPNLGGFDEGTRVRFWMAATGDAEETALRARWTRGVRRAVPGDG